MSDRKDEERSVMASDPFDEDDLLLRDTFYQPQSRTLDNASPSLQGAEPLVARHSNVTNKAKKPRPSHYKVLSISLYLDDIDRIDTLVKELKRRGFTKMNRSALIRFAIDTVDIDKLPRQY